MFSSHFTSCVGWGLCADGGLTPPVAGEIRAEPSHGGLITYRVPYRPQFLKVADIFLLINGMSYKHLHFINKFYLQLSV